MLSENDFGGQLIISTLDFETNCAKLLTLIKNINYDDYLYTNVFHKKLLAFLQPIAYVSSLKRSHARLSPLRKFKEVT